MVPIPTGSNYGDLTSLSKLIPGEKELWLGPSPQNYAVVEGKIWAFNSLGRNLNIKPSATTINEQNGEEKIILGFLAKYLEEGTPRWWEEGNGKHIYLRAIFGLNTIIHTLELT